jgi:hypothetical protein
MDEHKILENLKQLSHISPRDEFRQGLKRTLLATTALPEAPLVRRRIFGIEIFPLVPLATAAVLVLTVVLSLNTGPEAQVFAGLNNEEILSELVSSSDINISLNEFSSYNDADQKINVALKEASRYGTGR